MSNRMVSVEKGLKRFSGGLDWLSRLAMVVMLLLTLIDVLGAKLFTWPLPGAVEITGLLGLLITCFALTSTQLERRHVEIEIFVEILPQRAQAIISSVIALIATVLFGVIAWQMFDFSRSAQLSGRVTPSEGIPLYPFTYATVVCFIVMCPVLLFQVVRSMKEVLKK
jgi:TRAP-type C4-dicarboxylate transport system permease small subunit